MKTDIRTGGFGGGFTDARTVRPDCRAASLVPVRYGEGARLAPKKDARPVLQHRTGASNCRQQMTDDSLAHLPRWERWGLYALGALIMSGIAPMALAALLVWLCEEVIGWWLVAALYALVGYVVWRAVRR